MIRVVHPGSRIRMLTFSHPGSRIQGSKSHPITDPDPQHCLLPVLRIWITIISGFRIRILIVVKSQKSKSKCGSGSNSYPKIKLRSCRGSNAARKGTLTVKAESLRTSRGGSVCKWSQILNTEYWSASKWKVGLWSGPRPSEKSDSDPVLRFKVVSRSRMWSASKVKSRTRIPSASRWKVGLGSGPR